METQSPRRRRRAAVLALAALLVSSTAVVAGSGTASASANTVVSAAFVPTGVTATSPSQLRFTFNGGTTLNNRVFTFTAPNNLVLGGGTATGAGCSPSVASNVVTVTVSALASGATCTATFTASSGTVGQYSVSSSNTTVSGALARASGFGATLVVGTTPATVSVAFNPATIFSNQVASLAFTVSNSAHPGRVAGTIAVTAPTGLQFNRVLGNNCGGSPAPALVARTYTINVNTANRTCTVSLEVSGSAGSHVINESTTVVTGLLQRSLPFSATLTINPGEGPVPVPEGLVPIDPIRVIDTRRSSPVTGGSVLTVPLRPPAGATGVVLNVTSVGTAAGGSGGGAATGFLSVYPCGVTRPNASNLNYSRTQVVPNAVVTGLGTNNEVCVFVSETTNVLVDVTAWFTEGFTRVTPARLLETRGAGGAPGRVAAGSVTRVRATGVAGVPANARGVSINVTAVNATQGGFLTVYPCNEARPNTSSLNYSAGATIANLVVTTADPAGDVCVYSSAATDVLVDVFGWFNQVLRPVANTRLLDTRSGSGRVVAGSVTRVRVGGVAGVPANARGVDVNVTTVNPAGTGFITVYPCGQERPNTSNSNTTAGRTVANSAIIAVGTSGDLCIYSSVATDLLVDISGWFTSTRSP